MSNLDIARGALVYARDGLSYYRSNNKSYEDPTHLQQKHGLNDYDSEAFRIQKQMIFQAYDGTRPKPGAMMNEIVQYGRAALKERAGNCQEFTAVVCHYLQKLKPRPQFDAVYLEPPADHTFVVIGQTADAAGEFPMDFNQWSADAAICDPWANLACEARRYPTEWRGKLMKWTLKGKRLPGASKGQTETGIAIPGGWSTPLEDQWWDAPVTQKKLSFTYRDPGNGLPAPKKGCYITTAVCTVLGQPDDCRELTVLRRFRDQVLLKDSAGAKEVAAYYAVAPVVVATLCRMADPFAASIRLYKRWIHPAVEASAAGDNPRAFRLYRAMVDECVEEFLPRFGNVRS